MAVDEGRITAKALWAYSAQRISGDRSSSPESAKSGASTKAPRKRASKPKVRTGCLSCKRRHLKCDERKSGGCLRCETFGIPCEGYAAPKLVKETKPARVERALLPRLKAANLVPAPLAQASAPKITITAGAGAGPSRAESYSLRANLGDAVVAPPLLRSPSFVFEWEDEDNFYWSMFQSNIVQSLSPHFESSFWRRLSLREGIRNDCIRHSVLSIGAYYQAIAVAKEESNHAKRQPTRSNWIDTRRNKHHHAALDHHAKALGHLRQKMGSSVTDTRLTMMATLLFIAFENMQGNYHAAGSLIRSGIKILSSSTPPSLIDTALLHDTLSLPRPVPGTHMLATTTPSDSRRASPRSSPGGATSPNPPAQTAQTVDDDVAEMTQMFARLSTTSVYIPFPHCKFAYHMLLDHRLMDPLSNPHIVSFPTTLDEARASWDYYLPALGNFFQKTMWHNFHHAFEFDIFDAAREQGEHLAWLRKFGSVLEMLRVTEAGHPRSHSPDRARNLAKDSDAAAATRLRKRGIELLTIQHLITTIFTTCCLDSTEMLYDAFTAQFGEIICRCRAFVANVSMEQMETEPPPAGLKLEFCNDVGLLPLLGFVVSKCRNHAIRMDALSLLSQWDCREGSWDSRSLTNGMSALIGLEELGMDLMTYHIPAQSRFVWTNCAWNSEHRSMSMQFTRVLPDNYGEYERRDITATL